MQVRPSALAAALLPVGACLAMDPGGWSPFGPAKWLAVSALTAVAFALACRGGRLRIDRRLGGAWALLLAAMAVAAIGGLDPLYAWTGTPERHLGVLGWVVIAAAFVAGQQLRRSDRAIVAAGVVATGWVIGVYSVVEALWRAPIRLATTSDRLGGPFGSPAFLGAACALLLPATVGAALDSTLPCRLRIAAGPAAAGCLVALIGSAARAAWLATALVAGTFAVVTALARRRIGDTQAHIDAPTSPVHGHPTTNPTSDTQAHIDAPTSPVRGGIGRGRGRVVIGVVALSCVVVGGWHVGSTLERAHGAGSRVDEWRVALRVIGERPLLGTGPEGYRIAFPGAVDAAYERDYGRAVMPDRAHSGLLDVTATGGVVAGIAYVALLAMLGLALWRAMRRSDALTAGIAAGVAAYLLQQQLLFPLAELDPSAWLLAGAVVAWTGASESGGVRPPPRWQLALGGVAGAVTVAVAVTGALDVIADRRAKDALDATGDGRPAAAVAAAQRAVDLRPDVIRYRLLLGRTEMLDGTLSGVDRWSEAVDDALDVSPGDPIARQERGLALNRRAAITGTGEDTATALAYWRELVAEDPDNARWQLELGRAAAAADDVDLAREAWTTAADLAPGDPTAAALLAALPD